MAGPTSAECNNLEHLPSDSRVLSHSSTRGTGWKNKTVGVLVPNSDLALFHTHTIRAGSLFCTFTRVCVHAKTKFTIIFFFFFNIFRLNLDLDWIQRISFCFLYFVFAINNNNNNNKTDNRNYLVIEKIISIFFFYALI